MVTPALLEVVRPLRAAAPALGLEPLVARLREQRPDLDAGAEQVGEALRALQAEESEATANAAAPAAADDEYALLVNEMVDACETALKRGTPTPTAAPAAPPPRKPSLVQQGSVIFEA